MALSLTFLDTHRKSGMKKGVRYVTMGLVVGMLVMVGWDRWVSYRSRPFLKSSVASLPPAPYGILLGTAPRVAPGRENPFYRHRLEAALALYRAGKIDTLIVSGHRSAYYDEPGTLRKDLIAEGFPATRIVIDSEGDRTWFSMQNFQRSGIHAPLIIISQPFHNERAVFIARWMGIEAYGFNAGGVDGWQGKKVRLREVLARTRMICDLIGYAPLRSR